MFTKIEEGIKVAHSLNVKLAIILSFTTFLFLFSFISANSLNSLGVQKLNQEFNFTQVCSDATYITLTNIKTPTGNLIINQNMSLVATGTFIYNYTPNELGRHDFMGISDGCEKTFATYLDVTYDGLTNSNTKLDNYYILFIAISLILGLLISGIALKYDKRLLIMSALAFVSSGLIISYYPSGFANRFILDTISVLNYGIAFLCLALAIWEWLPGDW
jgi:hypothetical protein